MGKYKILSGQNIFDVALTIYGSIEGITDLMMSNPDLSLDSVLSSGDELYYTDDYIINADIVSYNRMNRIVPANGERNVYPKVVSLPQLAEVHTAQTETSVAFLISGYGEIEMDWGDNSPIQKVWIDEHAKLLRHTFDNNTAGKRVIRIYGNNDLAIHELDLTQLKPTAVYLYRPVYVERFTLQSAHLSLDFICLLEGTFHLDLTGVKTSGLLPLVQQKELMILDLTSIRILREAVDEYLIELARKYGQRRNCQIKLSMLPSGTYREPGWDEDYNYIYSTGMEAIWVITNEPAWNEAGLWRFDINGIIYSKEQ